MYFHTEQFLVHFFGFYSKILQLFTAVYYTLIVVKCVIMAAGWSRLVDWFYGMEKRPEQPKFKLVTPWYIRLKNNRHNFTMECKTVAIGRRSQQQHVD